MKILCIGHASYDITFPLDFFPKENSKNRVNARVECGGGPASTAAYLLGKWGMDVSFMGLVGKDAYGEYIKNELETVNVDTTYLEMNENFVTTSSIIIANTSIGSRTVVTYRKDDIEMQDIDISFTPDIILIDGQEYALSKKILEKYPNAISIIDAGRPKEKVIELSKMVNYVVCSKEFAEEVTQTTIDYQDNQTLITLYNKMEQTFKGTVIVTLESKGCLYKKEGIVKIMPSFPVKALDSTGAGDIFHGAFTYGIAKNMELESILKMANAAGALSVTRIGGRYSVPTLEEMKAIDHEFK